MSKRHEQRTRAEILAKRDAPIDPKHLNRYSRNGVVVTPKPFSRSKYTPHIGAKEQERAKRFYMEWTHGNDGELRSAPVMCQMSKATHAAYLDARVQEYESVF